MADNITAPATGTVLATDDIGGIQYPRTKLSIGADGAAADVHSGNPLPVSGTFWQTTQPVSAASLPLPTGAATEATISSLNTKTPALGQALMAASVPVAIASNQGAVTVTGTVAVTGTFWQATQPVSLASQPLPTGAATETTLAAASAKLPASLGAKAHGASLSVASAGLEYETVAASATAQAMGATGATGDYLSHVVVQPTSTAPGVVTVLDNATEVHGWPGGTVGADLTPIVIPIGAFSVSGAWKITTGANVKCTAYGDFT